MRARITKHSVDWIGIIMNVIKTVLTHMVWERGIIGLMIIENEMSKKMDTLFSVSNNLSKQKP